jgi:KDO2-lipid IV(A) lauroyltransferase
VGTTNEHTTVQEDVEPFRPSLLTRVEYWGFLAVAGLFRALPLETASAFSGWMWRVIAPRLRRHERARRNLSASMPELSPERREAVLLEMWEMLGRTFAEAFHLDEIANDPKRVTIDPSPEVHEAFHSPSGCVIVCLHMGNWEVAGLGAARAGCSIAGVYQRLKNPLVDRAVTRMRRHVYPLGLFSKGHQTVTALMRILRKGGAVALLADQRDHGGIPVPFFGRPAPSTPFPAMLARAKNVPLVAGRVQRLPGVRFKVLTEIVEVPHTDDRQADIRDATAAIHAVFERWIREDPGQWMWSHRRWG